MNHLVLITPFALASWPSTARNARDLADEASKFAASSSPRCLPYPFLPYLPYPFPRILPYHHPCFNTLKDSCLLLRIHLILPFHPQQEQFAVCPSKE